MRLTTSAGHVAIALHYGKIGDKFCSLGVYLAQGASDVSFERPTPVVILDAPGVVQRLFQRVADVLEPRKPLR